MVRSKRCSTKRPDTLMQLSRSSLSEIRLAPRGRAIHLARNGRSMRITTRPILTHLCYSLINFTAWHSSVSLNDVVMCGPRFEDGF